MTKNEALTLALETLEFYYYMNEEEADAKAITAIKATLANEALERKSENARELGLDYESGYSTGFMDGAIKALEAKDETAQQRMNKLPPNDSFERDEAARNRVREFMRNH